MRTLTAVFTALVLLVAVAVTQERRPQDVALQAAIRTETVDGNLESAIKQFGDIAEKYKADRSTAATALLHLAGVYQKRGDAQAKAIYERIVREFGDQKAAVTTARARLDANGTNSRATGMAFRRVWEGAKVDTNGGISPDGRYLSYIDWDSGDLALHDLVAGTDRRLTNKGPWEQSNEFAEMSTISRDGRSIAYAWFSNKDRYELRVLGLRDPEPQPRTLLAGADGEWLAPHDWSADGRWIAVLVSRRSGAEVAVVNSQDGSLRRVATSNWHGTTKIAFSPDGRYLAFDRVRGENASDERDLIVVGVAGEGETEFAPSPGRDAVIGWSADGARLLFVSDRGGPAALWAQRVSHGKPEGAPERIKSEIGHRALGLSAAGHLYVGAEVGNRNVQVATMDFRSGTLVGVPELASQRFVGLNEWPDWSPDGKSLSYVSARNWIGRNAVLVIQSLASGSVREFPMTLQNSRNPLWAPDSKSLVAQGIEAQGRRGLYSISAETGEASAIVHNPEGSFYGHPEYSRDGKKLYFSHSKEPDSGVGVVERDLASGTQRELLRRPGLGHVAVSPDGRHLTVVERNQAHKYSALLVVDVPSGETREVLRLTFPEVLVGWLSWSPDSRHVMVGKFGGSTPRALLLVALEGGAPRSVNLPGYSWGRIRVHPDGKRIAYLAGDLKSEVWVLENFLPTPTSARR